LKIEQLASRKHFMIGNPGLAVGLANSPVGDPPAESADLENSFCRAPGMPRGLVGALISHGHPEPPWRVECGLQTGDGVLLFDVS
jgi:hypothetical protein